MNPLLSNLLPVTIILLVFLSPLPTLTAFVEDIDGEPVRNSGGAYYIVPKGDYGSGLTLTKRARSSPCPLYITRGKATFPGTPVRISSPLRILYIPVSSNVQIEFKANVTTCTGPLEWRVTNDLSTKQSYVVAGGGGSTTLGYSFSIEEAAKGKEDNTYKIRYCPTLDEKNCGYVGFFRENGLLGITNDKPLFVQFKKASELSF